MPTTLQTVPYQPEEPRRMKFTRENCKFLEESGILTGRYELLEGDILFKMAMNRPHVQVLMRIAEVLVAIFGFRFVQTQCAIDVPEPDQSTSEPEPDIAVTTVDLTLLERNPSPENVLLLVEVSDATLYRDKVRKSALYARAGFQEYWIADVNARQLLVHRDPSPGGYRDIQAYSEGETVSLLARPDLHQPVKTFFPESPEFDESPDEN